MPATVEVVQDDGLVLVVEVAAPVGPQGPPGEPGPPGTGGAAGVASFNSRTGVVTLSKADVTATGLAAGDVGAQPVDSDLIAIAALTTTAYGRALLALVDAAAGRTAFGLGSAATHPATDFADATVTTAALAAKADLVGGLVPTSQIPALALTTVVPVASQAAMLALTAAQVQPGDLAVRSDGAGTFVLAGADPSVLANWTRLNAPTDVVTTVNGQIGTVVLAASDVGAQPVDADLTAIAALTTTVYGRAFLALADAAAGRAALGLGTAATFASTDFQPSLTPTALKIGAYNAAVGDLAMMNVAGGGTALALPAAPADRALVGYRAIGATVAVPLVVTAGGSDTIGTSGATTASVTLADEVVILQYQASGTRWLAVGNVKTQVSLDGRYLVRATTVAYAATVTPNVDTTNVLDIDPMTGNLTLAAPSGTPRDGQVLRVRLAQDATGGRTVTYNAAFAFGSDITAALDPTAASATWERVFEWNARKSKWWATGIVRGF